MSWLIRRYLERRSDSTVKVVVIRMYVVQGNNSKLPKVVKRDGVEYTNVFDTFYGDPRLKDVFDYNGAPYFHDAKRVASAVRKLGYKTMVVKQEIDDSYGRYYWIYCTPSDVYTKKKHDAGFSGVDTDIDLNDDEHWINFNKPVGDLHRGRGHHGLIIQPVTVVETYQDEHGNDVHCYNPIVKFFVNDQEMEFSVHDNDFTEDELEDFEYIVKGRGKRRGLYTDVLVYPIVYGNYIRKFVFRP